MSDIIARCSNCRSKVEVIGQWLICPTCNIKTGIMPNNYDIGVDYGIEDYSISAVARKLKTTWSLEAMQDLKSVHNIDTEMIIAQTPVKPAQPLIPPMFFQTIIDEIDENFAKKVNNERKLECLTCDNTGIVITDKPILCPSCGGAVVMKNKTSKVAETKLGKLGARKLDL